MFAYLFIDRYVEQGWEVYKHMEEFERMGVPNDCWRVTKINESYQLAETYPALVSMLPKILLSIAPIIFRLPTFFPYKYNLTIVC